jgi:hypothetical protein
MCGDLISGLLVEPSEESWKEPLLRGPVGKADPEHAEQTGENNPDQPRASQIADSVKEDEAGP